MVITTKFCCKHQCYCRGISIKSKLSVRLGSKLKFILPKSEEKLSDASEWLKSTGTAESSLVKLQETEEKKSAELAKKPINSKKIKQDNQNRRDQYNNVEE